MNTIRIKNGRKIIPSISLTNDRKLEMSTTWYVATLILKCEIENDPQIPATCFEQIHLIEARDGDNAYEKALQIGNSVEHSYKNYQGNTVYWEFVGLENLEEIFDETIQDGTEIRSRRLLVEDPLSLVRGKDGLTVFLSDHIRNKTAEEILSEPESKD
jgi:hypothetical protein